MPPPGSMPNMGMNSMNMGGNMNMSGMSGGFNTGMGNF